MLKKIKSMVSLNEPEVKQELTAKDIERGFKRVSRHIHEANPGRVTNPLRIVVSGGATSVIVLGNRTSTKDVGFMCSGLDEFHELCDAKYKATREMKTYPGDWLNAGMVAFVNGEPDCVGLFQDSVNMGDIMYQSDVLVVYAADWRFQLVGKIQRSYMLAQSNATEDTHHLSDAIHILHLLVTRNRGPLSITMVRTWYAIGPLLTIGEFLYVDDHYKRHFGVESGFTA